MTYDRKRELRIVGISGINYPDKHRKYLLDLTKEVAVKDEAAIVLVAGNTVNGRLLAKEEKGHLKHDVKEMKKKSQELTQKAREMTRLVRDLTRKATQGEKSKLGKSARDKAQAEKAKTWREQIKKLQKEITEFSKEAESFDEASFRKGFHEEFVSRHASELSSLFPVIPNVNYHIAIAEEVYDKPIGVDILERLREMREDIRLIGAQQDGTYDPEPKLPSQLKGFEEIRVLLPRKAPWYSRILSTFMQRLFNSFTSRTFSVQPDLVLAGCTGTAIYLPNYDGVPYISIPSLNKINEQRSSENMVGASLIRLIVEKERKRIIWGTYDFRPAIFNERSFAINEKASPAEKAVLQALISSPASPKTITFRILGQDEMKVEDSVTAEDIGKALQGLVQSKLVLYNRKSNQYAISERHLQQTEISLERLFKGSKSLREYIDSCFHCGSLKTLYHTNFEYLPQNACSADIWVENGDQIQGIAHAYETSGELLPTMMSYDKQELSLAAIRRRNMLDIFKLRFEKFKEEFKANKTNGEEIVDRCAIKYVFQSGNHSAWKYYQKHTLILGEYENKLTSSLVDGILELCAEYSVAVTYAQVKAIVARKIVRVGESFMVTTNGFVVGIKHPYKSRTESKSHRIQDVINFIWRGFISAIQRAQTEKKEKGFVLVNVANFHEAAAAHAVKFGRTALGVMTGAQTTDTRFESHMDKVVDRGSANALVVKNEDDRLLYSEVEFDSRIHPADEKICFADKITTADVLELCQYIDKEAKLFWRFY